MSSIKERICSFIEHKNISQAEFCRKSHLGAGYLNKIGDRITETSLLSITEAYPELNKEWVKTGNGDMLNTSFGKDNTDNGDNGTNFIAMVKMMERFIELGEQNSQANLINAEANRTNANNLERLISIIEKKLSD